ncbi:MAG: type 4a pilus biogenesis protein PilO [Planctomycetaceae bacterium]|nr:type 4a pilus biogenesis protein PilO [Planctomycetaceae bacterium]
MKTSTDRNHLKWIDLGIHIACVVVLILTGMIAYRFGYKQLETHKTELDAERQELFVLLNSKEEIAAAHQVVHEELSVQQQKLVDLLKRMPERPHEVDFLTQITGLARDASVRIQDYQPQQLSSGGEYRELQIKLNAQGSYVGICQFLNDMHELQRLNRVSQLTITPKSATRQSEQEELARKPQYNAAMQLHIYFMPVKKTERIASAGEGRHE